jgi:hypothetical protein
MPITFEVYDKHGNVIFGHAYCIIRNGGNAFRILDAQQGINIPLRNLTDLLSTVPERGSYIGDQRIKNVRVYCFMQSTLYQEWHDRTDNGNNYNISPFHETFYGVANNDVRERMMYNKLENNENNAGNNEGNYEGNAGNNEGNYEGNAGNNEGEWYEGYNNGYNEENYNVNTGGWENNEEENENNNEL